MGICFEFNLWVNMVTYPECEQSWKSSMTHTVISVCHEKKSEEKLEVEVKNKFCNFTLIAGFG